MTATEKMLGLVLAGGSSRRMGSDKASLKRDGEAQLTHAVRLLSTRLSQVFVSTRSSQADDPLRSQFDQIVDRYDDLGPVAGILSAMDFDPDASWLVVACDLPNIDDATISFLIENVSPECPVTCFTSVRDELPEPLCAIYRPQSRAMIDRFVGEGVRCPRKMLINSPTCLLSQPSPGALHNVNTPADLSGTGIELST